MKTRLLLLTAFLSVATLAMGEIYNNNKYSLTFYGTPITISSSPHMVRPLSSLNTSEIGATISSIDDNKLKNLLNECNLLKSKFELNDWGYLVLVNKIAHTCLSNDNEAVLLAYLIMAKTGYDVRLAKDNNKLYLMFASTNLIYGCSYFAMNNRTYYPYPIIQFSQGKQISFCNVSIIGEKPISFMIDKLPNLAQSESQPKELKSVKYPDWNFSVSCNENLIDFYNDIPANAIGKNFMTRWTQLANTPLSENVQRQLYPKMAKLVSGLSQREAVERILNWIQTAFTYAYDDDVWGKDRAFYPEETLFYPYNDTEDRSALMSRIITDLLNLKTLFLYYPGHTAIGIAFTDEDVEGNFLMYEGEKYTICDGVYIGAPVGAAMPGFENLTPQALPVNTVNHLLAGFPVKLTKNVKRLQPTPQPIQKNTAIIEWIDFASTVKQKEYQLKVGIKSASKIEETNIMVNGSQSRGINTVKSDGYDQTIKETLKLSEGYNSIVVTVRNADGITTSEKKITCQIDKTTPAVNQKRIALVMGNSNYQDANVNKLKNPVNDATDIAAKLKSLGFTVICSLDQTKKGMESAIREFGNKAMDYDVALFYYAGHGIGCNGNNYLIPIDADIPEEDEVQYQCTNANLVLDKMEKAHIQMKIVILDACRNNPFARSWNRSVSGDGLNIMNAPKGTFIAFSTAPGDVAQDGKGRNSPYTAALLETLDTPLLSITDFFQEVLEKVATQTGERQNPWTSNSFRGKFFFNQKK